MFFILQVLHIWHFTLGEVKAMSLGGKKSFVGKKIMEFFMRFVIGWLNHAEDNDWPPRVLI